MPPRSWHSPARLLVWFCARPKPTPHRYLVSHPSDNAISPTIPTERPRRPCAAAVNGSSVKRPMVMRPMALSRYAYHFLVPFLFLVSLLMERVPSFILPPTSSAPSLLSLPSSPSFYVVEIPYHALPRSYVLFRSLL